MCRAATLSCGTHVLFVARFPPIIDLLTDDRFAVRSHVFRGALLLLPASTFGPGTIVPTKPLDI